MNVLIIDKPFIQWGINVMRLVGIHRPPILKLVMFVFHLLPCVLLHHELSRHLVPTFLPVNPRIHYQNCHIINPCIHSDQPKPTTFHRSKLVVINDQTVVIQFVLIHRTLKVKFNRVLRTQFMNGNHALFGFLYFNLTWNVAFKRSNEKAIRTFLNLSDLNIFGPSQIFPLFCMLYVKLFRHITDWFWARLLFRAAVIVFAILEVNVFQGLLGIEF